ncbi:chondroitin proteoglycan 2-like [Hetaerina americana]|uniref:chondroitin proteoglycan 2-like n=1 Tax=Hetaerina americana TaxID=62018 RepID=UPI003A7F2CB5
MDGKLACPVGSGVTSLPANPDAKGQFQQRWISPPRAWVFVNVLNVMFMGHITTACLGLITLVLIRESFGATIQKEHNGPLFKTLQEIVKGLEKRDCDDYEPKECPDKDGEFPVFLPDDKDCTRFYECSNGAPILKDCSVGLHFDRWNHICDLPSVAGCDDCTFSNEQHRRPKECPEKDGEFPVFLPDDKDCTRFYECSNGAPILKDCSVGLHFDRWNHICDLPSVAGCDDCTMRLGSEEGALNRNEKYPECPEEKGEVLPVLLPHEDDCMSFYVCHLGKPILQHCPVGFHFHKEMGECDLPEEAECEESIDESFVEYNTIGISDKCFGADCPLELEVKCPDKTGDDVVQLPNPKDCSTFYKCDRGIPVLIQCPKGLNYNNELRVCDYPWNANCVPWDGGDGDSSSGEDSGSNESGSNSDSNASSGEVDDCPSESDLKCPSDLPSDMFLLPNPKDCLTYYACDHGILTLMRCPEGLHYNRELKVCDYPWNADCVPCNEGGGEVE